MFSSRSFILRSYTQSLIYFELIGGGACFSGSSDSKAFPCKAGDLGSGRHPGEGNGNALQYSYVENFMDRGAWWPTVHGFAKSRT